MKKFRTQLAEKQELYFLIGFLILFNMHSVGLGVTDVKWLAMIALAFLGIKIVITSYAWREIAIAGVMLAASLLALAINSDKMLLLSVVTIIAVKNCEYRKIFIYCAASRVVLMSGKIALVALGVLPNSYAEGLTKYSAITNEMIRYDVPTFGYGHPNFLYLGAVAAALLIILVYQHSLKWYWYLLISAPLYLLYRETHCRAGFYMWICILLLIGIYRVAELLKCERVLVGLIKYVPVVLFIISIAMPLIRKRYYNIAEKINWMFSGRFTVSTWQSEHQLWEMFLPQTPWMKLDNGYFFTIYNYGWIVSILMIGWIVYSMYLWSKRGDYYFVLGIVASMGYWLGEAMAISTTWNPCILLLAVGLYQKQGETESRQDESIDNTHLASD